MVIWGGYKRHFVSKDQRMQKRQQRNMRRKWNGIEKRVERALEIILGK
jgi:hypothetical protein